MGDVGVVLAALAEDTRRGVVEVLAEQPVSAGELADRLEVTPALLTRHLRILRDAGVVRAALDPADHRRHVYELVPDAVVEVRDWADRVASFWGGQLASFASHARKTRKEARRARR